MRCAGSSKGFSFRSRGSPVPSRCSKAPSSMASRILRSAIKCHSSINSQFTRQIGTPHVSERARPARPNPGDAAGSAVPSCGRSRRKHPILEDRGAADIVEHIDWDFQRFNQRARAIACALRAAMFDEWVSQFLREHPAGTVIEIGAGLSTRFERLDNGSLHWFDLDLPDVVELRRKFLRDGERHRILPASVVDAAWMETVGRSPGPSFFVAETVFITCKSRRSGRRWRRSPELFRAPASLSIPAAPEL